MSTIATTCGPRHSLGALARRLAAAAGQCATAYRLACAARTQDLAAPGAYPGRA